MSSDTLILGLKELIENIVKDAVKEAFQRQAEESLRYPEKVAVEMASQITGYSKNSLYQMHSRGQIPGAIKVGGKLMFDTATLRQWVDDGGRR